MRRQKRIRLTNEINGARNMLSLEFLTFRGTPNLKGKKKKKCQTCACDLLKKINRIDLGETDFPKVNNPCAAG